MTRSAALLIVFVVTQPGFACAADDLADVRDKTYRLEPQPKKLRYRLIGSAEAVERSADGYKLMIVLPGGDGGSDFTPFIKRIYKYALSDDYLVIQLIAPKWNKKQQITWPVDSSPTRGMKVSTEEFLRLAVENVAKRTKIDRRCVYALAWSSGGPAAYAASTTDNTPLTGVLAAMSVFREKEMRLPSAAGKAYYVLHSEEDKVCPFWMARRASQELPKHGAKTKLQTYPGGHGWRGDVFGNLSKGVRWLEQQTKSNAVIATPKAA